VLDSLTHTNIKTNVTLNT